MHSLVQHNLSKMKLRCKQSLVLFSILVYLFTKKMGLDYKGKEMGRKRVSLMSSGISKMTSHDTWRYVMKSCFRDKILRVAR